MATADDARLEAALAAAGDSAGQLQKALDAAPADQAAGVRFLIENMPERDLRSLSAEYLLENTKLAYQAWREAPWRAEVDEATFLNYVLPYACVNERRDRWRADFYARLKPLVADSKSAGEAATVLNNQVFKLLGVRYSTKRAKADQSPYESTESGLASCTGLSVILIDACRAVGVPARFVGVPLWSDHSGNHSWVEVWDDGWRFTGAAEPTGMRLDEGWFTGRAALAKRDTPRYAVYAASFARTPLTFPCVWDRSIDYVWATNVTDRYTKAKASDLSGEQGYARLQVLNAAGERLACGVRLVDSEQQVVGEGETRDERFDANDHLSFVVERGKPYTAKVSIGEADVDAELTVGDREQLFTLHAAAPAPADEPKSQQSVSGDKPVRALRRWLEKPAGERPALAEQAFADAPLSRKQAESAKKLLWADHAERIRNERSQEIKDRVIVDGDRKMPFFYQTFGRQPKAGRRLFISMHGGGGAPAAVNDQQYRNQQHLYEPAEGVYLAPRAPTNTWDLWHQEHIDRMFARLIEDLIVLESVDPDRVYLMGYSAGGDGAYQLAPRMADRLAAAAMMAGHPNDASPLGLRNIGFAIYMGGNDAAYDRNQVAKEWGDRLDKLAAEDPDGYKHQVTIYPDKGHWMDREDASAVPWMSQQRRNPTPDRVVWKQDDVLHQQFYWLATDTPKQGALVTAEQKGQQITVEPNEAPALRVRLSDAMLDLDEPVTVVVDGRTVFDAVVPRTIGTLAGTLAERGDPGLVFAAEIALPDDK
ncbi:transglutaminase domain-containing protein [Posidoniimonas polymericola]|uniref:transglutaminase domain-containing protein n=1 Tax=Posidoniimonas polymericola TaxID=2528002 RepID=UPI001E31C96D|nr:transglutaminase domain-containing protein [Posidoniimonas polymericola]